MPAKGIRERYEYLLRTLHKIDTNDCVLWQFAKGSHGYGVVVMPDGKRECVHRIAFHFANGRWPEPLARHICTPKEQKLCFNPRHLIEGSDQDNSDDKCERGNARGGSSPGTTHPMVILTEEQVREIRAVYIPRKVTLAALGQRYGVSMHTIFDIVKRRSWTHIE